jgi:hypothetical protein
MALVQSLGRPVAEDIWLGDLSKARDPTVFLYPVLYRARSYLYVVSDTNTVHFLNRLAEDEVVIEFLLQR